MANGNIAVNRNRPCPICGKSDWCSFWTNDMGYEYVICKREKEQQNVQGHDGKFYVFTGLTKEGENCRFMEAFAYQELTEKWKKDWKLQKQQEFSKREPERPKTVLDQVDVRTNEYLDKIYRYILSLLPLEEIHKEYLLKEGWSEKLIEKHQICSFPEDDYYRFKYENNKTFSIGRKKLAAKVIEKFGADALIGVPGAYMKNGTWTFHGQKGIFLPQYDVNGKIYRLRLRLDFMDVPGKLIHEAGHDPYYVNYKEEKIYMVPLKGRYRLDTLTGEKVWEKGGKYRNFSSYRIDEKEYKNGFVKNVFEKGCEAGNTIGIYMNPQRDNMYCCFLTEGEKKGMFANDIMRMPVGSFPGVNSFSLLLKGADGKACKKGERVVDILRNKGCQLFIVAYDADLATNQQVLKNQQAAIKMLIEEGVMVGVAKWDMSLGKGLDDLLANGHKPEYEVC